MIPPNEQSLVKYDTPLLVSTNALATLDTKTSKPKDTIGGGQTRQSKRDLPPVDGTNKAANPSQAEDILNAILPPREWSESGRLWVQYVSSTPATRLDVINLQSKLDQQLEVRQARETGICPIREELYSQCFDELIRQVTVSCAERGLLLLRVRDEMRMTIAAFQSLYESSVAFGMRKALQSEQGKCEMVEKISSMEEEIKKLEKQVAEWKSKSEAIEKREAERRQLEERKHSDEVAFLQRSNKQLKTQLEQFISIQKK